MFTVGRRDNCIWDYCIWEEHACRLLRNPEHRFMNTAPRTQSALNTETEERKEGKKVERINTQAFTRTGTYELVPCALACVCRSGWHGPLASHTRAAGRTLLPLPGTCGCETKDKTKKSKSQRRRNEKTQKVRGRVRTHDTVAARHRFLTLLS